MKEKWPLGNRAHGGVTFQLSDKQKGIKPNIWPARRRRLARRKSEQDDALAAIFSGHPGLMGMCRWEDGDANKPQQQGSAGGLGETLDPPGPSGGLGGVC